MVMPCSRQEGKAAAENKGHPLCSQSVMRVSQSPGLVVLGAATQKSLVDSGRSQLKE